MASTLEAQTPPQLDKRRPGCILCGGNGDICRIFGSVPKVTGLIEGMNQRMNTQAPTEGIADTLADRVLGMQATALQEPDTMTSVAYYEAVAAVSPNGESMRAAVANGCQQVEQAATIYQHLGYHEPKQQ